MRDRADRRLILLLDENLSGHRIVEGLTLLEIPVKSQTAIMGISQFMTSSSPTARGNLRFSKNVMIFNEYGIAMLSSVLNSPRAIQINIQIMRTFGKLREMIASHKDLARKLEALEKKYDAQFQVVFNAIRELMTLPEPKKKRKIGFSAKERQAVYGTPRMR